MAAALRGGCDEGGPAGSTYFAPGEIHSVGKGKVNKMNVDTLREILESRGLSCRGHKNVLKKRLKEALFVGESAAVAAKQRQNKLECDPDLICVIDFEATCEEEGGPLYPHEVSASTLRPTTRYARVRIRRDR